MKNFAKIRKGQWVRLSAIVITLVAVVLFLTLPQITIAYQKYSNTSTAGARDYSFPLELISGIQNLTGNGYFAIYRKSAQGPEVLTTLKSSFNGFALSTIILAIVACGLDIWLTFTKKNEKWSKLTALLFVICGIMAFMGPIFFLVSNGFGVADWTASSDIFSYWIYDSLYVHDAYGAVASGIVFFIAAVAFGVGTSLEGGDKNDIRNQD